MRRTPHYITQLKTTRIPDRHYVIDTEARVTERAGAYTHKWVCGAAALIKADENDEYKLEYLKNYAKSRELWDFLVLNARTDDAVVWAHNLAYDIRISRALEHLPELGFHLDAVSIARTSTWAAFTHSHGGTLTLCDIWSWCPVPLDVLMDDLGQEREEFDYATATDPELYARCLSDVAGAAEVVTRILNYLSLNDLGSFRPTGSGQCHAAWRRKYMPAKSVLVHCDEHALERERRAMHTGRTEAWKWGKTQGPIAELDMSLAYCRIAASNELPGKLAFHRGKVPFDEFLQLIDGYNVLADVKVKTSVPVLPVTDEGRVYWPIGEFRTTVWDPEIILAAGYADDMEIERVWCYKPTSAFLHMAQHIIKELESPTGEVDPVIKRMLKHWSRALVGRCALRYRSWEPWGIAPNMRLMISHYADQGEPVTTQHLQIGAQILELSSIAESTSSVPQVTGWVQSQCRRQLWQLMTDIGLQHLLYVDTDGILVCGSRGSYENILSERYPDGSVRIKAMYRGANIRGPRNLEVDTDRRISGIPKRAIQVADLEFDGQIWSGLESDLEGKHTNTVRVHKHKWTVQPKDHRREHLKDGITVPYRRALDES